MVLHNQSDLTSAKRVVVKVGSSSISGENQHKIEKLVDALAAAHKTGQEVILVTSGAIATGMPLLNLESKPDDLATSQALASVGQGRLISRYQSSLERYDLIAGQVLLTAQDLEGTETRENAKRAMERLVSLRVIPIVNENDTVATAEIRFGDNDRLAALVAVLVDADALILLSDVDALYDMPPTKPGAKRIERVAFGDELAEVEIGGSGSSVGTGGAVTKVSAARVATEAGVSVLLTSSDLVAEALTGQNVGTWFEAKEH
jgi:glutamate 5-kinase